MSGQMEDTTCFQSHCIRSSYTLLQEKWHEKDKQFWANMAKIEELKKENAGLQDDINHIRDEMDRRYKDDRCMGK